MYPSFRRGKKFTPLAYEGGHKSHHTTLETYCPLFFQGGHLSCFPLNPQVNPPFQQRGHQRPRLSPLLSKGGAFLPFNPVNPPFLRRGHQRPRLPPFLSKGDIFLLQPLQPLKTPRPPKGASTPTVQPPLPPRGHPRLRLVPSPLVSKGAAIQGRTFPWQSLGVPVRCGQLKVTLATRRAGKVQCTGPQEVTTNPRAQPVIRGHPPGTFSPLVLEGGFAHQCPLLPRPPLCFCLTRRTPPY